MTHRLSGVSPKYHKVRKQGARYTPRTTDKQA
nr:MAG TPA: hypothetical protein [Caudoviricetes sp.]